MKCSTRRVVVFAFSVLAMLVLLAPSQAVGQGDHAQLTELRDELAERVKRDQQLRNKMIEQLNASTHSGKVSKDNPIKLDPKLLMELHTVDAENTKWMKEQVDAHGWLGASLVGRDGAHNAWLLVQHADADPEFQQRCLDLMNDMPDGEVDATDIAYLTDRVLAAAGKPQRYGTQVELVDGRAVVKNVEDEPNLDKRRAELGLQPMREYLQLIEEPAQDGPDAADKINENGNYSESL